LKAKKKPEDAVKDYNQALSLYGALRRAGEQREIYLLGREIFGDPIFLDTEEADVYASLGSIYSEQGQYEDAVDRYQKALRLEKSEESQAEDHWHMGWALSWLEKYHKAAEQYQAALRHYEETGARDKQAEIHYDLGSAEASIDEYERALAEFDQARNLIQGLQEANPRIRPSVVDLEAILYQTAFVHLRWGRYERAKENYEMLRAVDEKLKDSLAQGRVLRQLGFIEFHQGHLSTALKYYEQARQLSEQAADKAGLAGLYASYAEYYLELVIQGKDVEKNSEESLDFSQKALDIATARHDRGTTATVKGYRARVYVYTKAFEDAQREAKEELDLEKATESRSGEAYCLETLGLLAEAMGQSDQALGYYQQASEIYDDIRSGSLHAQSAHGNLTRLKKIAVHKPLGTPTKS